MIFANESSDRKGEIARPKAGCHAGSALLEVMLACAVAGISLAGFAAALQQSISASAIAGREADMRIALESRLAELAAEKVQLGERKVSYSKGIVVEQRVEEVTVRNQEDQALEHLYRVRLRAVPSGSLSLPLETETLIFQP